MSDDWRQRAYRERARADRAEGKVLELEARESTARLLARRLWRALALRRGLEAQTLFGPDEQSLVILNPVWEAAASIWEKHRVTVIPCETILEPIPVDPWGKWPQQSEMYVGRWPDGSTRNLTREQLLMMGGIDPQEADARA